MKKTKIKKDLFNRIKEIGSENKVRGITLISLVITIIVLLILAGITIAQLTGNLINNANTSKDKSEYATSKEKIGINLYEIMVYCAKDSKEFNITEVAKQLKDNSEITILKYYNESTSMIAENVTENIINLDGIVISYNVYPKYKFLIGKDCKIDGVTTTSVSGLDELNISDYNSAEVFEANFFGKKEKEITSISVIDNQDPEHVIITLKVLSELGVKSIELPDGTIIEGNNSKEITTDELTINSKNIEKIKITLGNGEKISKKLEVTEWVAGEQFSLQTYQEPATEPTANTNTTANQYKTILNEQFAKYRMTYEGLEETDITYYKIGESDKWNQFKNVIDLDMSCIQTKQGSTNGTSTIYIKKVSQNGHTVIAKKTITIESTAYDPFTDLRVQGKTVGEYFTEYRPSNQYETFDLYDMWYGHWKNWGWYSGYFTLPWNKLSLSKSNRLYVEAMYNWGGGSVTESWIEFVYTDATTSEKTYLVRLEDNDHVEYADEKYGVIANIDPTKTIDYVKITINGYDADWHDFKAAIRDVVFLDAERTIN